MFFFDPSTSTSSTTRSHHDINPVASLSQPCRLQCGNASPHDPRNRRWLFRLYRWRAGQLDASSPHSLPPVVDGGGRFFCEMSGFVNGAIFYVTAFVFLTGAGLVWDVWRNKECFEIAARSPLLLCLAGAAHVILVLLQMMAGIIGSSFPCTLTIWASYLSFGVISTAYLLRAARLLVVYDRELRQKYKRLVNPSAQKKCMCAALTACCVISLIVQLRFAKTRRRSGVCYFFSEGYSVFLPITLLYLMAMGAMANRLKDANDAFHIRNEIGYICVATAITSAMRTVHITLLKYSSWWNGSDKTVPPTIHDLAACAAALYVSFYRPLRSFYGVGRQRSLNSTLSARQIYCGSDREDEEGAHHGGKGGRNYGGEGMQNRPPETWGLLQMLRNDTLRMLLVNFCEKNLCGESVDFLVDVAIHYESMSDPGLQFDALSKIVETYLAQGSVNEVNVSNSYRNEASKMLENREAFLALSAERRAHVLDRQRDEIAKMLAENLLVKFKQTPMAINAMRALKEMAAAESTATGGSQDEDMKSMLHASAAAEVAEIQRLTRADKDMHSGQFDVGGGSRAGLSNGRGQDFTDGYSYGRNDSMSLVSCTFDSYYDN